MNDSTLIEIIYISIYSALLPIISFVIQRKKIKSPLIYIFLYVSFAFLFDVLSSPPWTNAFFNSFALLQIILLSMYYQKFLGRKSRIPIIFLVFAFILYFLFRTDFIATIDTRINSLNWIGNLMIIVLSFFAFYKLLIDYQDENILNNIHFWVNSGLLIYYAGTLFVFCLAEFVKSSYQYYIPINNGLNIIKNIILAVGLWKVRKTFA